MKFILQNAIANDDWGKGKIINRLKGSQKTATENTYNAWMCESERRNKIHEGKHDTPSCCTFSLSAKKLQMWEI